MVRDRLVQPDFERALANIAPSAHPDASDPRPVARNVELDAAAVGTASPIRRPRNVVRLRHRGERNHPNKPGE